MLVEKFPDVAQVLTLSAPSPEMLGGPDQSPEFARIANDGMAEICKRWPDQFPVFVASLPMNNVPEALKEMDRAINTLGARGVQLLTSVNGRPLDDAEFFPIFERMANHHQLPIWMHPFRPGTRSDYPEEERSLYEIWQVLGIITHHCGGMLPYFAGRAESLWAQLGSRSVDGSEAEVLKRLSKPPIEYFKMFYGDTVLGGSRSALRCGLDFFGIDHVVFASDCPFDPEGGPMFIREGIKSIEEMGLNEEDQDKLYLGNALRLMRMNNKNKS